MGEPLDVLLRVRMRYEAAGGARQVVGDLDQIRGKAQQLGAIDAGNRLGRELREVGTIAGGTRRDLSELGAAATRLGQGNGPSRLQAELKGLAAPVQTARREVLELGTAVRRLGDGAGPRELERELERAGRRADDVRRRVAAIGSTRAARSGDRHRFDFGNEALLASGVGGALRFGMSGAAVAGVGAGVAIGGVAGGLAAASRQAVTFETAMAEVQKAVNDLTPDKLAEMERVILRTSRATGIAKEEMAKLVAEAGFAGRPAEELTRFAEFGAKAANAFGMTAGETGEKLAKLGNIYKINQAGIEDLADGINLLGDNTAAKERQIVGFLTRAGESGKAIGMTAFQTGAIGAAMVSAGQETEVAATAFNAFAQKLGTAKDQSKEFHQGLRAIGTNSRRLKADLAQDGFEGYLKVLERIAALPKQKQMEVAARLGGLEHGDELLAQVGQIDQIRAAYAKVQDQAARAGSVEKTFKLFDSTTQSAINRAGASMEAFAVRIGQKFTPAIRDAAHYVERLFGGMTKAIERGERAEALATKLAKGGALTPKEQAEVDASPRLKDALDKSLPFQRRRLELEENRRKAETDPGSLPTQDQAREAWQKRAREWEERRQRAINPETLPGTGKRSALSDDARVGLASYTEEVETSLDRTERIVRDSTRRMREDLAIKARVDIGADRFGGARIETAAYGGVPIGGGGGSAGFGGGGRGEARTGRGQRAFSRYARGSGTVGEAGRRGIGATPGRFGNLVTGRAQHGSARFGAGGSIPPEMMDRARQLYTGLREEGFSHAQAAALIGHAEHESGIGARSNAREGADGLIHWRQDRLDKLRAFAGARGEQGNGSIRTQAAFLRHEMDTDPLERRTSEGFRQARTVGEASAALKPYIRYGDDSTDKRTANAERYDRAFRDGVGSAGDGAGYDRIKGFANLMRGQYGGPGENLTRIEAPSGKGATVHAEAAESFQGFLKDLEATGYKIDSLGGYANRGQANGSGRISQHAYGNAIDINPSRNPYKTSITDMPENVSKMAAKWGLSWGGDWSERSRDPMHFEWTGAQPWKNQQAPIATAENKPAAAPFGLSGARLEALERTRADQAARRLGDGSLANMPDGWMRRAGAGDDGQLISPRFSDPAKMQVSPRGRGEQAAAGGAGGRMAAGGGPAMIQHFHGGFDEQATARRAVLEQNREIRRTQARALHDIGRIA